jgi:lipoprotein-anchoring transpeptidase ErfK/SrfK
MRASSSRAVLGVLCAVALVATTGCATSSDAPAGPRPGTVSPTESGPPAPTRGPVPSPSSTAVPPAAPTSAATPAVSVVATALADAVDVFGAPGAGVAGRTVAARDVVSLPGEIPLTFLVAAQRDGWVQVHLPVRPNGSTGWVRGSDVVLSVTDLRIEVRLAEHRLLLHRGAEVVLDVPVGVGRSEVPTPGGVYYVKELLQPPDPGGTYGPYAYGLSGYSPVLHQFAGGQGVIGIHGTDRPESVGTDASHGCLRLRNEDVTRLVEEFGLPLGTPVEILA